MSILKETMSKFDTEIQSPKLIAGLACVRDNPTLVAAINPTPARDEALGVESEKETEEPSRVEQSSEPRAKHPKNKPARS